MIPSSTLACKLAYPAASGAFLRRLALKALALALALVVVFAFAAPLVRAADDPVLARVNGVEIRQSDLTIAEDEVGSQQTAQMSPEQKRDYLVSFISDMLLVSKAAETKKFADNDDFKRKLAFARNKLLMEQYLQSEAKAAVTDAAMHKVYDEAVGQMSKEPEVRARHILVETEDEARAVLAELKKGADFAELAKAKSKDPGSSDGGDLGYFTKDQMVPEFSEVAFKLDKGQLSDPVKSQFGWHIIKVEDKRVRQPPEFDKVKDQLEQYVVRRQQVEMITNLRKEAKIEKLTPPAAPAAPAEQKK